MPVLKITNSFRRNLPNLADAKKLKIKELKDNTEKIILEKYPYYTQINNINNTTLVNDISKIRSLCNKIETNINNITDVADIVNIRVNLDYLYRLYNS
jgi:hypothetical protein